MSLSETNDERFLQLYYRASGRGVTDLSVFLATTNYMPLVPSWSSGSFHSNAWSRVIVSLNIIPAIRRQIILQAKFVQKSSWINIDDIVYNGEGGLSYSVHLHQQSIFSMTLFSLGQTVSPLPDISTTTPQSIHVIDAGTCSFDVGLCPDWLNLGAIEWKESLAFDLDIPPQAGVTYIRDSFCLQGSCCGMLQTRGWIDLRSETILFYLDSRDGLGSFQ